MAPPDTDQENASIETGEEEDARQPQKVSELKQLRTTSKSNITRIKTLIGKKGSSLSTEELECRLGILESYFKQCMSVQASIDKICREGDIAANAVAVAEIEDAYVTTKSKIMSLLSKQRPSVADVSVLNATHLRAGPRLRREDDSFDDCERFLVLKEHLGPRPLAAVADFDVTDDNYQKAMDRLKECFDKKALMFDDHVSALFSLAKADKPSFNHLRHVVDSVNAHISAMLSLGNYKDIANAMVIHLVMGKVDEESQVRWEESVDYSKISSWEECSAILTRRYQNLEAREAKCCYVDSKPTHSVKGAKQKCQSSLAVLKGGCTLCKGNSHSLPDCSEFLKLTVRERFNVARRARICFTCLRKGYAPKMCTAPKCPECNSPHHKLVHRQLSPEVSGVSTDSRQAVTSSELPYMSTARSAVLSVTAEPQIFLATALVLVKDSCGRYQKARAVLDSASQINIMCENLAQKLSLKKSSCQLEACGVGDSETKLRKRTVATVKSSLNEFERSLEFYLLPKMTSSKPDRYFDISSWNIPKNIKLADPAFNIPGRVDILIGAEIFLDLLAISRILLHDSLPRLQKTTFGWIVAGKADECLVPCRARNSLLVESSAEDDSQLSSLVQKFWETEQITTKTKFFTQEEEECEQIFLRTVRRTSSGRFIVKIPFTPAVENLGESYNIAERRLASLERRLTKDEATRKAYNEFMREYLELGHMTEVEDIEMSKIKYFAPHQHVLRPESSSTKLRVVFDCSCKTSSGLSLNDVMMKGPIVQNDLLSIILRFRCYKYAITVDVTKMYRQMWVTDGDADFQAVLWRLADDEKVKAYRLRTIITYGTTAAPYLATRCLKMLGEDCVNEYPLASKTILSDFYMDDLISGSNNEDEVFEIYRQVNIVMNSAKLTLRKWYSNSEQLLNCIPTANKEKTLRLNDSEIIKTLGIIWAPVGDTFRYVWPNFDANKAVTKRIVLAELAKLFDPLGLINPVIVKGKIFMQDLWILHVNWDESLPMNLHSQWTEYREKLKGVEDVAVPRFVLSEKKFTRVEMHGFADALKRAYGCCVYIRTISADDDVTIRLWSAKSRVAPLKTQSLPRLELMAAGLLSQLVVKTKTNFPIQIDGTYLWTDSEIVLDWLSEHPSNWNTFVANRVSLIQEESKTAVWRHVPSKANPVDIISRGSYAHELINSFWFAGPEFLKKPCCEWPANKVRQKSTEANTERVRNVTTMLIQTEKSQILEWIEKQSDFEKLQRNVARLLCIFRKNNGPISSENLDESLIRVVYCIQQHYYQDEIALLSKNRDLLSNSKYQSLSLFLETCHGVPLLRVGGRLANAILPYDAKHQILLPSESEFVRSCARYLHLKYLHAGTQALIAILRQKFWVPHARSLIRSVTSSCLQCFRCRPKLCNQVMGDLPPTRVAVAKPFTVTGVDFCGPITTTVNLRGCRKTKSYIAVFICFCTKAVHLEVVSDLRSKAFIASLKRFVARRGLCSQLWCDNATNFVGARRELEDLKRKFFDQQVQDKISKYCTTNSIDFRHIPPRSPHFGGLWEAAVKSVKYHLARVFGESHLTFEELATVVAEVEAILNSRLLTALSNDPNDESVLTPAHFLTAGPLVGIAEPSLDSKDWSNRDRWLRVSAIQQHFWRRWSTEYLQELQRKVK